MMSRIREYSATQSCLSLFRRIQPGEFIESLVSLNDIATEYEVSAATAWRWVTVGVRGVKLEHRRIGARIVVTREAVQRFFDLVNIAYGNPHPVPAA